MCLESAMKLKDFSYLLTMLTFYMKLKARLYLESTDAGHRGGPTRSGDEVPVAGIE